MGIVHLTEHVHEEAEFLLSLDQILVIHLCVLLAILGLALGASSTAPSPAGRRGRRG